MERTSNAVLVEKAIQRSGGVKALTGMTNTSLEGLVVAGDERVDSTSLHRVSRRNREPYAHALSLVNDHITVKDDVIAEASTAYEEIANLLVDKLNWERADIKIYPQGSASTKTLIRTVGNRNFDIDAVCEVDISTDEALDPMAFFESIGAALKGLDAIGRRRCWTVNYAGKHFYIDFTPSVPLTTVPLTERQSRGLKRAEHEFLATALAVVDTPSENWKTSNPVGIRDWVNRASERQIVLQLQLEAINKAQASIEPISSQSVEVEETLRVAIRLFKRHRDMCVYRGHLELEYQPISIILVTLLTTCYEGLADLIQENAISPFPHVVDALIAIANLLPEMIPRYPNGDYYLDNPTVVDENFAERWNTDEGQRAEAFRRWCTILRDDLQKIVAQTDAAKITSTTLEVFGCVNADRPKGGNGNPGLGLVPPTPKAAPVTSGLA
ncbi:hypothetical protein LMG26684_04860 [Achromobacter mucicolens]|uniref:nucleotidyltransferase domain-containing protein n=1 Tax=Achromobacter mucicolens TaxID=1389922 RepID=UPI0014682518|nr:nucleotidyltransferase [Achromobacter mucicolens]CAB3906156.1 hypothetical protein LMG26684_04860 [Achromobacter mucicolens]